MPMQPAAALYFTKHLGNGRPRQSGRNAGDADGSWDRRRGDPRPSGGKSGAEVDGRDNASQLAEVIVSVGLAQNLAALRALATEGHPARPYGPACPPGGNCSRARWTIRSNVLHSSWLKRRSSASTAPRQSWNPGELGISINDHKGS